MARVCARAVVIDHYRHSITLKGGEVYQTVRSFFAHPVYAGVEIVAGPDDDVIVVYFPRSFTADFTTEAAKDLKAHFSRQGNPIVNFNQVVPPGYPGFMEMPVPC